jgi:amidase
MSEICFQSATALAQGLRRREIGSRELLELFIKRVESFNPQLNAVVTLDLERARASADAADAEAKRGAFRGSLHGLPITVKDTFETAGLRTTAGAKIYEQHVPTKNAVALQRLIDAGAIIFGKTNTPAFAADVQTYNEIFGVTNNPWDRTRTPGGSSGGAAVAVATGLTAFELGSDIGGSIRIPAHCCGVYGHKTTYGIVSSLGHIPGPPGARAKRDISVAGPLSRAAEDLDLVLATIAGPLPEDAVAWQLALPPPRRERLADYRIGVWLDDANFTV